MFASLLMRSRLMLFQIRGLQETSVTQEPLGRFSTKQSKPTISIQYFATEKRSQIRNHNRCEVLPHRSLSQLLCFAVSQPEQYALSHRGERFSDNQIDDPRDIRKHQRQDQHDDWISAGRQPDSREQSALDRVALRQADDENRRLEQN